MIRSFWFGSIPAGAGYRFQVVFAGVPLAIGGGAVAGPWMGWAPAVTDCIHSKNTSW